jgi:hypothetical protein
VVVGVLAFHVFKIDSIPIPAALKMGKSSTPQHLPDATANASSSAMTPLPAIHNSKDTECADRRQCSNSEFADLVDNLRRQWVLVPEEIRSKCANYLTYPPLEHCVLSDSISWLAKHPNGVAPWINPKNFDTAVMAICQKHPTLALCLKP